MAANPDRKAGTLNHIITPLLVQMDERDAILTMDADTELAPVFVRHRRYPPADPEPTRRPPRTP